MVKDLRQFFEKNLPERVAITLQIAVVYGSVKISVFAAIFLNQFLPPVEIRTISQGGNFK
jgi:hypothetical protein